MIESNMLHPTPKKRKRIFWLGMHKVLMQTEFPRLQSLGYEVFNPPYLSNIEDQSALLDWTMPSDTTLPLEVQRKLAKTNFFYKPISQEIAEIINYYFDAAIVTINPDWLQEFLKVFRGPLIYRVYGQPYSLADSLLRKGTIRLISERDSFWFSPHTDKTLTIEDPWLLNNMRIIPYCLTNDVILMKDSWTFTETQLAEMGMLCPRIADIPYYTNNYRHLKHYFSRENYRIFGGQLIPVQDSQVVGTLPRDQMLLRFRSLRGFIYHYGEPTVCYLPPLEFMTIGGPVVFLKDSLLDRFFETNRPPGRAQDIFMLQGIASKVEHGDVGLIDEIISSQEKVRKLYHPDYVWPIFDQAMHEMLEGKTPAPAPRVLRIMRQQPDAETQEKLFVDQKPEPLNNSEILLAFHKFGPHIYKQNNEYHCAEGIARVTRLGVKALTDHGYRVIVTSYKNDIGKIHGFFASAVSNNERLQILAVDGAWNNNYPNRLKGFLNVIIPIVQKLKSLLVSIRSRIVNILTQPLDLIFNPRYLVMFLLMFPIILVFSITRSIIRRLKPLALKISTTSWGAQKTYIKYSDTVSSIVAIWVPHYYHFPELKAIAKKKIVLYLPDYLPHFYPGNVEMGSTPTNEKIGKAICKQADIIFTNSRFSQKYLPETVLKVDPKKIRFFPLPNLNHITQDLTERANQEYVEHLPDHYVFYPTRERPSKRLIDFVDIVAAVNTRLERSGRKERLYGVLTTIPSDKLFVNNPQARSKIKVMSNLSDIQLQTVYKNATALLFTSELEGNFPTQISEALSMQVPIIATRIPLITEELGEYSEFLKLVDVGNIDGFASEVVSIMDNRLSRIEGQEATRAFVAENFSYKNFESAICDVFEEIALQTQKNKHNGFEMKIKESDKSVEI